METPSSFDKIILTCAGGVVFGVIFMAVLYAVFMETMSTAPVVSTSLLSAFVFVAMLIITFIVLELGYSRQIHEHYDRRYAMLCERDRRMLQQLERMSSSNE